MHGAPPTYFCFDPLVHYSLLPKRKSDSRVRVHPQIPSPSSDAIVDLYRSYLPRPTLDLIYENLQWELTSLRSEIGRSEELLASLESPPSKPMIRPLTPKLEHRRPSHSPPSPAAPHPSRAAPDWSLAELEASVNSERRAVRAARSEIDDTAQKIEGIHKKIRDVRQSVAHRMRIANQARIEALVHRSRLAEESHKCRSDVAARLGAWRSSSLEVSGLEEELANAESEKAAAELRYATLVRAQRDEAAEIERILRSISPSQKRDRRRLLVGIFTHAIAEKQLRSAFAKFGKIESVKVVVTAVTPRRYMGQVQFCLPGDAARALAEMHCTQFMQQQILVRWASKQPQMPDIR
jgi:hypothetical protein